MFERFTDDARRVVVVAQEEARDRDHNSIGSEHLLLALLHDHESVAARALRAMGVDLEQVRAQVDEVIGTGGRTPAGHIPFTPSAKKVLEFALREALQMEDTFIGPEHILLGLVREGGGVGAGVLAAYGVDVEHIEGARAEVVAVRGEKRSVARGRSSAGTSAGMLQSWSRPAARQVPRCSVCGRDDERCERVLVAGGMRICSDCVRSAAAQLDALPADAAKLVRFRPLEFAPSDKDAAVAAIERAFDAALGPLRLPPSEALWAIEGGEDALALREQLDQDAAHAPVVMNDQTVERVRFLDEGEAEVSLGLWPAGSTQPMIHPAHAVLEDGTWKVRRSSVEHFAQLARQFRQPPGT